MTLKKKRDDSLEKVEDEEKIQDSDNTTEEAIIDEENLEEKDFSETPPISDEEVTQDFIQPAFGTTLINMLHDLIAIQDVIRRIRRWRVSRAH